MTDLNEVQAQGIPAVVNKRKEAINLYTIAVVALAIVSVLAVLGGIALSLFDRPVPESMVALGGVALGALAGMVAPTQGNS